MTVEARLEKAKADRLRAVNAKLVAIVEEMPTNPISLAGAKVSIEFAKNRARAAIEAAKS